MILRLHLRLATGRAAFIHPLDPAPPTAILASGFRGSRSVRVFPEGWSAAVERFRPSAIAAPVKYLRELTTLSATLALRHAVIAFTNAAEGGLSDRDRDLFWSAFGVPVFEQYLGMSNELIAAECHAHAGLHVIGVCGDLPLDDSRCACGNPAPRLARSFALA